jgi:hypothetical protein
MNSGGRYGTVKLTHMARNCVWPKLLIKDPLLAPAAAAAAMDTAAAVWPAVVMRCVLVGSGIATCSPAGEAGSNNIML